MKMLYDKQTGTLLDATHVLIGDIDPYEQTTDEAMIIEILAQDRPLYEFENDKQTGTLPEKGCPELEVSQEQFVVWICYITDNYGSPLVVKVVSTEAQAQMWINEPLSLNKKDDDEVRGHRYAECFVVEAEQ